MPPTVIYLSQTPGLGDGPSGFSQASSGDAQGDQNERSPSRKGKERETGGDRKGDNIGRNDGDPGDDPEDPPPGGADTTQPIEVSYDIASRMYSSQNEENLNILQFLTTEAALTIQTTPLNPKIPDEFSKCRIQFSKLRFGSHRTSGSMTYGQFHLRVAIDPQQENADVTVIKPQQSIAFEREMKESSAVKTTRAVSGSLNATLGLTPQATVMAATTRTSEVSGSSEKKRYTSRITQQSLLGVVWWGFCIDDPYEQEGGIKLSDGILPTADFEFLGDSDIPAPPPKCIDIEVASYWSITAGSGRESNWIRRLLSTSSTAGCYSNLCQIVALGVPSGLAKRSDYRATLHVNPGNNNSKYSTEVRRQTGSVEVTPTVSWGQDPASVVSDDLRRLSVLKLPTLTRVRFSDSYALVKENPNIEQGEIIQAKKSAMDLKRKRTYATEAYSEEEENERRMAKMQIDAAN